MQIERTANVEIILINLNPLFRRKEISLQIFGKSGMK